MVTICRRRASSRADTSRLHQTRVLYYVSEGKLCSYNVDTREDRSIDVGVDVCNILSTCGMDLGVACVFTKGLLSKNGYASREEGIYYLDNSGHAVRLCDSKEGACTILASNSDPWNLDKARLGLSEPFTVNGNKVTPRDIVNLCGGNYTVARMCDDVFLVYKQVLVCVDDYRERYEHLNSWLLVRIDII